MKRRPQPARSRTVAPWACRLPGDCFIQQAVSGLAIGMLLIDPEGRVVWLNRAAERVLGISADECLGRSFKRVFRDPQLADFWREVACRDGNCMADISLRWPRRVELKLNATQCHTQDGREIGRALLFCDITAEHEVRLELTKEVASRLLHLAGAGDGAPSSAIRQLTNQELRTLRLVGRGLANEAIAAELGVETSTVRTHLKSVYRKLGLHSRAAAVSFAVQQHLT